MELLARARALGGRLWQRHGRELGAFGVVGGLAFVIDVGLFNLLRFGGEGLLADKPLTAKLLSASLATLFAWAGNRWWTFRHRHHPAVVRELVLFFVMNGVALLIAVLCLATSHYVLGLRSPLADNVSANFVGVALGTAFRYVAYRLWVFRRPPGARPVDATAEVASAAEGTGATDPAAGTAGRRARGRRPSSVAA